VSDDRLDDEPAHAPLGPSAAEGWATCSDYVNANAGLPDEPTYPAAEGTVAHGISNTCLTLGFDASDFIGTTTQILDWTFTWTEEDAFLLQRGIDRIRALPGQFFGEHRVRTEQWTIPGQFGTLDRAGFDDEWIWIEDLKWGRFPVYPYEHLQNIQYALGFWNDVARHHTNATKFALSIDQPRCAGGGGVWYTTLDELLKAGEWLKGRAALTQQPNPPRTASEKGCVWCRRRRAPGGCDTYSEFNTLLIGNKFEDMDIDIILDNPLALPTTGVITPERRSFILSHRKMMELWMDMLAEQELADYLAGRPTPGRKAVVDTQKGTRDKWKDEKAAEAALVPLLGDKSFTKKLITPVQAGKQIGPEDREIIAAHIEPGVKGKSMVPEADARPAIPVMTFDEEAEVEVGEVEK